MEDSRCSELGSESCAKAALSRLGCICVEPRGKLGWVFEGSAMPTEVASSVFTWTTALLELPGTVNKKRHCRQWQRAQHKPPHNISMSPPQQSE